MEATGSTDIRLESSHHYYEICEWGAEGHRRRCVRTLQHTRHALDTREDQSRCQEVNCLGLILVIDH